MSPPRRFHLVAVVAALGAALVAAACSDSVTPTEMPAYKGPTPVPLNQTWKGTFTGASARCDSAAAVAWQGGSLPTTATVGCLNAGAGFGLSLSRQGGALTGYALLGDAFPITGTLSESAMDITIFGAVGAPGDGPSDPIGTLHVQP